MCSMKKLCAFILLVLVALPSTFARRSEVDSLFAELDRVLQQGDLYVEQRERKINDYKQSFGIPSLLPAQRYEINRKLYDMYYPFKPDSAIVYARQGIQLAETLGKRSWVTESKLRLASVYTMKSMFIDALELIRSIPVRELSKDLQRQYYSTYIHLLSLYPPPRQCRDREPHPRLPGRTGAVARPGVRRLQELSGRQALGRQAIMMKHWHSTSSCTARLSRAPTGRP